MFATIQSPKDLDQLKNRLEKLHANTARRWGTMTPAEMLYHLRAQQEAAIGHIENPPIYENIAQNKIVRWLFIYVLPWPRSFKTAKAFNAKKQSDKIKDFATEKSLFVEKLHSFIQYPNPRPHPLFGDLSKSAWDRMVWKHIDYHFRQFGV